MHKCCRHGGFPGRHPRSLFLYQCYRNQMASLPGPEPEHFREAQVLRSEKYEMRCPQPWKALQCLLETQMLSKVDLSHVASTKLTHHLFLSKVFLKNQLSGVSRCDHLLDVLAADQPFEFTARQIKLIGNQTRRASERFLHPNSLRQSCCSCTGVIICTYISS